MQLVIFQRHKNVPANDEDALMKAAANQPTSVAIDAGGSYFQFYSEGVFTGGCGTELDRGVAIVGYGTTLDGTKYWIVKNSWGTEWVEKGYIRMQRGISDKGLWYSNGGFVSKVVKIGILSKIGERVWWIGS